MNGKYFGPGPQRVTVFEWHRQLRKWRCSFSAARYATFAMVAAIVAAAAPRAQATAVDDIARMSLEELSNVEVTSVSKSSEALRHAAATIYVITREDILRSGATSIPEVLRLAPNLEMRQLNANSYVGAARGFAGSPEAQNFSNKLLILIDGRSVYSPLFSGVYYDAQDVLLEDIDRIEVISGPGATLWGANAMNGVINIITRPAYLTDDALITVGGGNFERNVGARYGGQAHNLNYRVYAKAFKRDELALTDGSGAQDDWRHTQAGYRLDWQSGNDTLTAQGDGYRAVENQAGETDLEVSGGNALARWQHRGEQSELQVQAYVDNTRRGQPPGGAAFVVRTYDLEIQQRFNVGAKHKLIVGGGERLNRYKITDNIGVASSLLFVPHEDQLHIGNVFVHDTMTFSERFQFSLGLKLEEDPYSGWEFLPDARFAWRIGKSAMLWASAARAIRSPTPFDHDVVERFGPTDFLTGNKSFEPERVNAFELGYRGQPIEQLALTIATFYNRYDALRSIETASPNVFLPLRWGNKIEGTTYGVEAWAKWQVTNWWRLSPGVRALHKDFAFKSGASQLLTLSQAGNDPSLQASLASAMNFGANFTFDVLLRYVGDLPEPALDEYHEMNVRIGWQASDALELSLSGFNLVHAQHRESATSSDAEICRSVFANARWRF